MWSVFLISSSSFLSNRCQVPVAQVKSKPFPPKFVPGVDFTSPVFFLGVLPWYNRQYGWLGVNNQLSIYLLRGRYRMAPANRARPMSTEQWVLSKVAPSPCVIFSRATLHTAFCNCIKHFSCSNALSRCQVHMINITPLTHGITHTSCGFVKSPCWQIGLRWAGVGGNIHTDKETRMHVHTTLACPIKID